MKPYIPYYEAPNNTQVKEHDSVEITSGSHKGTQGVVCTIHLDGYIKLWVDVSIEATSKLWVHKPTLKLLSRPS